MARIDQRDAPAHRLLVVDDDRELLRSTQRLLRRRGYEVQTAADGPATLALLRDGFDPDGILLDWYMKDVTAEQLLPSIRELCPDAPVMIVSGWASGQSVDQLVERLGVEAFHDKGDGAALLVQRIEQMLRGAAT